MLLRCKTDYEKILAREIALYNIKLQSKGRGWVLTQDTGKTASKENDSPLTDLCFATHILENPTKLTATSVNDFTEKLIKLFTENIGQTRMTDSWARSFSSSGDEQLIKRTKTIEKNWLSKLQKKMSRVTKLSKEGILHHSKFVDGFFVHFTDFNQAFVSFRALSQGQQRMQMDPQAPSRSYLKIEEAFRMFGKEPSHQETVIDLGAAPGGWSYSALKRGAIVTALDNGPLKDPVKSHKNIRHLKVDALKYTYEASKPADWLLCDILDKPEVIFKLLKKWMSQRWCRSFIVNIKVGRNDPILLLKKIRDSKNGILPFCKHLHIRQLYHDREEITLMGQTKV